MIGLWGGNSELARRQLEFGVRECPFFNSRAIFECTLAALNLRERRQQPKLDTVDPSRIIPFPAAMVVYVHVEAERQCITPAEMGLRMLRLPQFQPAAKHLRRLYGLAGEQRIPDYEDAQVREALWQEEKKLLLHAA